MKYDKTQYVGKSVRLYPGDTYYKYAVITGLDDLGWTFKITKSSERNGDNWKVGQSYFISHSKSVIFEFI
jgi:hypothetical protein